MGKQLVAMATIDGAVFDSDHFTWNEPYLTINTSDCVGVPHVPPARESRSTQGHITSLVQPGDADWDDVVKKSIAWRKKIAKILVEDFMEINPGQRGKYSFKYIFSNISSYSRCSTIHSQRFSRRIYILQLQESL